MSAEEKAKARRQMKSPERTVPTIQSEGTDSMMERTQELMGGAASPSNHTREGNYNMTKSMGFNDTAMQMAHTMEQFVPVPPIGAPPPPPPTGHPPSQQTLFRQAEFCGASVKNSAFASDNRI
jgi:hypothetical protein